MIVVGRRVEVDLEDLIQEHDEIDRLSRSLERIVASAEPDAPQARSVLRALARVVAAHLRKEESFVYPGLSDGGDADSETVSLVAEFERVKAAWMAYVGEWQRDDALRDWTRFGTETIRCLHDLREHAMGEIDGLYERGLRQGLVRLRPTVIEHRTKRTN